MMKDTPILPGSWLGLMGGGQLGRMFAQAAATMGYRVCVLEPDKNAPAAIVAEKHICAPYTDEAALTELASLCKTVTTEFENVPAAALEFLASKGAETCPAANAVRITQDRFDEKSFIKSADAPVAPHLLIESDEDLKKASAPFFPAILKTARLGYDGKGQITVNDRRELAMAFEKLGKVRCVLEKRLPLFKEVSVIAARNSKGEVAVFPVSENYHRNGILAVSVMPARLDEEITNRAREIASKIIEKLDYVGVLCTELFVLSDGRLVVNELAPRPHNSGHATIDACICSQYEQQVRAMANLPLGDTTQVSKSVMLNLLGDLWFDENENVREPDWSQVLDIPGLKLHLYGKKQPRHARKMGHITCLAATEEEAMFKAQMAARILGLELPE